MPGNLARLPDAGPSTLIAWFISGRNVMVVRERNGGIITSNRGGKIEYKDV